MSIRDHAMLVALVILFATSIALGVKVSPFYSAVGVVIAALGVFVLLRRWKVF